MNKTIVYVIALVVVSLIAGALLGVVLCHRQGFPGYGQMPGRFAQGKAFENDKGPFERLSQILNLSVDQKLKLAEILKQSRQEVMQIQHKTKETFMEIKKKTNAKIKEILTPEQQVKFDELKSNLQQRMKGGKSHSRFLNRAPDGGGPLPGGVPGEELP